MDEAKMRVETVGQINALLANRNAAVERLNRAKAELGTARSEVERGSRDRERFDFLGVDNLEHFTVSEFWSVVLRCRYRAMHAPIVRATCSSPALPLQPFLSWWFADGLPLWDRSGVVRWARISVTGTTEWTDAPQPGAVSFTVVAASKGLQRWERHIPAMDHPRWPELCAAISRETTPAGQANFISGPAPPERDKG